MTYGALPTCWLLLQFLSVLVCLPFTDFKPHWHSCCSLTVPDLLLPWALCTHCFLYRERSDLLLRLTLRFLSDATSAGRPSQTTLCKVACFLDTQTFSEKVGLYSFLALILPSNYPFLYCMLSVFPPRM